MKNVLLITYYYPPRQEIGSQRPYYLSKYLPEYGWKCTVFTVKLPFVPNDNIEIIQTEYYNIIEKIKKTLNLNKAYGDRITTNIETNKFSYAYLKNTAIKNIKNLIVFPDTEIGWYKHAVRKIDDILRSRNFDVILSTSYPVTSHLVANYVHRKYGIPWVADFRDLWTYNHYYDKIFPVRLIERALEHQIVNHASAIVTVSKPLSDIMGKFFSSKNVYTVTNSYDVDDYVNVALENNDYFNIVYTGTLYKGKRDPSLLFKAISRLIADCRIDKRKIRVEFYGRYEKWLELLAKDFSLEDVVIIYNEISRDNAIAKQASAKALLLLLWDNPGESGVYTGKLFEYLGAKRPIISCGGDGGVVSSLLAETDAGRHFSEVDTLYEHIYAMYSQFLNNGIVTYSGNIKVDNYSATKMAHDYSVILDDVIKSKVLN